MNLPDQMSSIRETLSTFPAQNIIPSIHSKIKFHTHNIPNSELGTTFMLTSI